MGIERTRVTAVFAALALCLAAGASRAGEPEPKPAAEPAKNLLQNGDFEKADASGKYPLGWDRTDGLTTFWAAEKSDMNPSPVFFLTCLPFGA